MTACESKSPFPRSATRDVDETCRRRDRAAQEHPQRKCIVHQHDAKIGKPIGVYRIDEDKTQDKE